MHYGNQCSIFLYSTFHPFPNTPIKLARVKERLEQVRHHFAKKSARLGTEPTRYGERRASGDINKGQVGSRIIA